MKRFSAVLFVLLLVSLSHAQQKWTRTYGGTGNDLGRAVQQTSDGGYIVAGVTASFGSGLQAYLIKTNASGDTLWTKTYGGTDYEDGSSVQQTTDGGYIIAGRTDSFGNGAQVYLVKTNASGDTLWTRNYGGSGADWNGFSVQQTSDGGYIIPGFTESFGNGYQVYLIKTDSLGSSGVEEENKGFEGSRVQGFKVKPNPFVSFATVPGHENARFALYDVSGRLVGKYQGDRIGEGLRAGVYFLKQEGKDAKPVRIVKVR